MIHFGNPAALWLLTLLVPLLLLYLLKHRKQDRIVPSLLLWKQAMEDDRAQTPFQKLRSNLLLLLQILILVLLTALLSKPFLAHASQQSTRWILILDISASMNATDETPSRFEVAKNRLLKALERASPVDEIMLISLSSESSIVQSFSRNHVAIRSHLSSMQTQDVAEDWDQLEKILQPLVREKMRPRILIASDFANFPPRLQNQISFEAFSVGKSRENLAFTRVSLQPVAETLQNQVLFFEIRNLGKELKVSDLEIRRMDDLIDAYEVSIGPDQTIQKSIQLEIAQPVRFSLKLKAPDYLQLDNDFVVEAFPREKIKINLAIENPYLIRALRALPAVEISNAGPILIARATQSMQVAGIFFEPGTNPSPSEIVQWNAAHPVLRFVDAALWRFSRISVLDIPEGADVLLETKEGPIGYALDEKSNRRIVLGFSLEDSNLTRMGGFPVFLQNATQWIGETLQKTMPMTTGDGQKQEGPFETEKNHGYANFLNIQESKIQPGQPSANSSSDSHLVSTHQDLSSWFLLCLISVVILEWWAFHQKYEL